jgi:hypothetical protein
VSNEVADASRATAADPVEVEDARAVDGPPAPALVLIRGDDDLVCIDDTCLPPDAAR